MGSHAFNPSIRELEAGVIWLGGERNIRQEETGAQGSLRFGGNRQRSLEMQSEDRIAPWFEHW